MRLAFLLALTAAVPLIVSAGAVADLGGSNGTVDFTNNGSGGGKLTLDGPCLVCLLGGAQSNVDGLGDVVWSFAQSPITPFSFSGYDGTSDIPISTKGTPILPFIIFDDEGDRGVGTFTLDTLGPDSIGTLDLDGGNGIDIYGTFTLLTLKEGKNSTEFSEFQNLFSGTVSFVLDVGDCTSRVASGNGTSVPCIASSAPPDPVGSTLQLQTSSTPEPATFGLMATGLALAGTFAARRRLKRSV